MTRQEFCDRHRIAPTSILFPPDKLFSSRRNPTRDPERLRAVHFEHFRFAAPQPDYPAALVAHVPESHTAPIHQYAGRHRVALESYPSWHRKDLVAVALLRAPPTRRDLAAALHF